MKVRGSTKDSSNLMLLQIIRSSGTLTPPSPAEVREREKLRPAKESTLPQAGIQTIGIGVNPRFRGGDGRSGFSTGL
jgi:hypothetical protein